MIGLITFFSELTQEGVGGERGGAAVLHRAYQECVAVCWDSAYLTWLSSASARREQMNAVSSHHVRDAPGEMRLLAFIVFPTQLGGKWEGMDDGYREGQLR